MENSIQRPADPQQTFTSEAAPLEYKGVGRRFLALLLDSILLTVVLVVMAVIYGSRSGSCNAAYYIGTTITVNGETRFYGLCGFPALIYFLLGFAYFVLLEWLLGGTLGKLVTGLRVTTITGERIGPGASLLRNFLRIVDVLPGCIPYLVGAILVWSSDKKQRLGDRAANTVVVSRRSA
jgi:uncharacterized RDD family membrane protein YckC